MCCRVCFICELLCDVAWFVFFCVFMFDIVCVFVFKCVCCVEGVVWCGLDCRFPPVRVCVCVC